MKIQPIILESQTACEAVVEELNRLFERRAVTVGDLNDLLGKPNVYTDHQWGWIDQNVVSVKEVESGWLLDFPDPKRI